jgi:4a-hydroxytetrahydrobiopterin dehydratase
MSSSRTRLTDAQIAEALATLPDWRREGDAIRRTLDLPDFAAAMALVNRVADLAEAQDHHPEIVVSWKRVTLGLSTHSAGGITRRDIDLAAAIDALVSD